MGLMYNQMKKAFADHLYQIGVFQGENQSPGHEGFHLELHDRDPGAPLSPYYLELARLQSDFEAKIMAVRLLEQIVRYETGMPELIAPVPQAIVPVISSLSDKLRIPMITPRKEQRPGVGNKIDGIFHPGQSVLLFDDVISSGYSKRPVISLLQEEGLKVVGVVVIVDREQGGRQMLVEEGFPLFCIFTITELLNLYNKWGLVNDDVHSKILASR